MTREAGVQSAIRLEAARLGFGLWRNNSGACRDTNGRLIRYGLGNDSAKINAVWKSPDLVGIVPVMVTPEMVGTIVGVFLGVEVKHPEWRGVSDAHELAQQNAIDDFRRLGGRAGFARSIGDMHWIAGVGR